MDEFMKNPKFVRLCLSLALSLSATLASPAATITWTNLAGGNWSAPINWSPNQVPGAADTAVITNGAASYTVTQDVGAAVAGLVVGAMSGANIQTFANNGETLTLNGPATVPGSLAVGPAALTITADNTNKYAVKPWRSRATNSPRAACRMPRRSGRSP